MEIEFKLKGQLSDTYYKTLELAKNISKNRYQYFDEDIHKDHIRFLKNVSKGFRDFKDLDEKYSGYRRRQNTSTPVPSEIKKNKSLGPKTTSKKSGKLFLDNMIEESYQLACRTRTGRGGIRNLTPSPPPILEKLKNNKDMYTESSDQDERPLAFFSLLNGKTEEIELPSFRECIKGNKRIDSQSEIALQKIKKCKEKLGNFEKEINGLEIFCKYNPGIAWNLDKKLLLKLGTNPGNKFNLIRAYNEKNNGNGSEVSRNFKGFRKSPQKILKNTEAMPSIEEKRSNSMMNTHLDRDSAIISNCFDGFRRAKMEANTKTIQILEKLKAERPLYLRKKANLIISDSERYRGRIHSFQTLDKYKKHIEKERYMNVLKSKSQINVYTQLLDYLKRSKGMPSQSQISFVEAIREILEGGWSLNSKIIDEVLSTFSAEENHDLSEVVGIIHDFLQKTSETTFSESVDA